MFHPVTVPFGAVMLFNVVKLKEGVSLDDVELTIGEMCNVVKNAYGDNDGGFIAGQVFRFSGFVSEEGSLDTDKENEEHIAIVTYWHSFDQHEKSHADALFKSKFGALMESCRDAYEIGYEMMWQGEA